MSKNGVLVVKLRNAGVDRDNDPVKADKESGVPLGRHSASPAVSML